MELVKKQIQTYKGKPRCYKQKLDLSRSEINKRVLKRPKRINFTVNEQFIDLNIKFDTLIGASGKYVALKCSSKCI